MEEENEAILFALVIGAVILGVGLALFFIRTYTGFGAVVMAIGLMTWSLIITMRAEEIIHLKIYPTANRSETIAEVSVENRFSTEPAPQPSAETQAQEVLESEGSCEVKGEQAPEVQEAEETQQVQEVEETEQPLSRYEPAPPPQEAETPITQELQEASFAESEQEPEPNQNRT